MIVRLRGLDDGLNGQADVIGARWIQAATLSAARLIRRRVSSMPWFTWRPRGANISAALFAS